MLIKETTVIEKKMCEQLKDRQSPRSVYIMLKKNQ